MSQNGQTHFKNFAANALRFLKSVCFFRDVIHLKVNLIDTGRKLNVYKTFKRLMYVQFASCVYGENTLEFFMLPAFLANISKTTWIF